MYFHPVVLIHYQTFTGLSLIFEVDGDKQEKKKLEVLNGLLNENTLIGR